ncbi:putative hydrolase of the HAD superfamily [Natrinema salifodinae]|uniref:Putative hydrolase of the HAD superfamily n=2 Tax=Natrinema salifodinae TaxID=1202768 RepID=A0A1I0PDE1_9EURY|nr:putative hydrolase of the HAD superfamily [Natrinema salifodinae]
MAMAVDAVLFDLDDTCYPYPPCNEAGKEAAWRTARELGYDFDREAFDAFYREGRRDVKRDAAETAASHDRFLYFKRALERHAGTHRSGDALAMGEAYWAAFVDELEPFPGVTETFATLADRDVDVAIVTNLTTRIQLEKLDAMGLDEYVDLLVTSEELGREKPASLMFTHPLARLDRRPSETVMVGNSIRSDIEGANAVGIETVLFNGDGDADSGGDDPASADPTLESHRKPDHRIDSFRDVLEVIR